MTICPKEDGYSYWNGMCCKEIVEKSVVRLIIYETIRTGV